jgi:hypothetical protein
MKQLGIQMRKEMRVRQVGQILEADHRLATRYLLYVYITDMVIVGSNPTTYSIMFTCACRLTG